MPKRVVIVERWGGTPIEDWYPWLKVEAEKRGCSVEIPDMPNPDVPKIEEWVPFLEQQIVDVDGNTYFVGHSVGVQTILRYLEDLPEDARVGGLVSVAGWFTMNEDILEEEGSLDTAKPWFQTPIDFGKVRRTLGKIVAIFSENDPFVPIGQAEMFRNMLGAETILMPNRGHFTSDDDVTEAPEVLDALLEMMQS